MRGHRNTGLLASMLVAGVALSATPREAAAPEQEPEAVTNDPPPPTNLPGETNRQFAARMKQERLQ